MAEKDKVEKTVEQVAKAADEFLKRFVIKKAGKVVSEITSDNHTVQAPEGVAITKGERPAILAELKKRFPRAVFTWVG